MRGTGIDSDVEIYATKQSNEHQYVYTLLHVLVLMFLVFPLELCYQQLLKAEGK
jgi:hypothetical protein